MAGRVVCPVCGGRKGWAKGWALNHDRPRLGMCGLSATDLGDRRHGDAPQPPAVKTWFLAAHIVASHSNGISALQLQAQLGLGSYKTAWLLLQKLRRAMVDPGRSPLQTLVEIDETEMPFRSKRMLRQVYNQETSCRIGCLGGADRDVGALEASSGFRA